METESIVTELQTLKQKRLELAQTRRTFDAKLQTIKAWKRNKDRTVDLPTLASYENQLEVYGNKIQECDFALRTVHERIRFLQTTIHDNSVLVKCPICGHTLSPLARVRGNDIVKCDSGHSYRLCLIE